MRPLCSFILMLTFSSANSTMSWCVGFCIWCDKVFFLFAAKKPNQTKHTYEMNHTQKNNKSTLCLFVCRKLLEHYHIHYCIRLASVFKFGRASKTIVYSFTLQFLIWNCVLIYIWVVVVGIFRVLSWWCQRWHDTLWMSAHWRHQTRQPQITT